jgi:hypothetical protein
MKVVIKIATLFSNAMCNLKNYHEIKHDLRLYVLQNLQIVLGDLYYYSRRLFLNLMTRNTQFREISRFNCVWPIVNNTESE